MTTITVRITAETQKTAIRSGVSAARKRIYTSDDVSVAVAALDLGATVDTAGEVALDYEPELSTIPAGPAEAVAAVLADRERAKVAKEAQISRKVAAWVAKPVERRGSPGYSNPERADLERLAPEALREFDEHRARREAEAEAQRAAERAEVEAWDALPVAERAITPSPPGAATAARQEVREYRRQQERVALLAWACEHMPGAAGRCADGSIPSEEIQEAIRVAACQAVVLPGVDVTEARGSVKEISQFDGATWALLQAVRAAPVPSGWAVEACATKVEYETAPTREEIRVAIMHVSTATVTTIYLISE